MDNTLEIQKYEEEIAVLSAKIRRLEDEQTSPAAFYVCRRCGLFYQSKWGCGCPQVQR